MIDGMEWSGQTFNIKIFIGKTRREEGDKMVLAELITASGSMITAWAGVLTEVIKLPVEMLSTIFDALTG